jgi:hypothetical protein
VAKALSWIRPVIYSIMVTNVTDSTRMITEAFHDAGGTGPLMILDVDKIRIELIPYKGQKGPSKNPLFVNCLFLILAKETSSIQPKKA